MAAAGSQQPNRPKVVRPAANPPLQLMKINRKEDQEKLEREAAEARAAAEAAIEKARILEERAGLTGPPRTPQSQTSVSDDERFDMGAMEGMTMADLLGAPDEKPRKDRDERPKNRSVDDFDFDEEAFLAALDENSPVGTTGEVIQGTVIALESDGIYVDIGGKAPGFMPKSEAGLGVITNLRERFPKGKVEVLVTRAERRWDGHHRLPRPWLRKSWDKVKVLEKEGKVVQVIVNGFNRGGVTCDLEGLRGFIPRSQLQDGENHQELVGKTLGVAFIEVNSETRKLVLSEKRASVAARFQELEVGQLVEGLVAAVKPYGLFIDLGGISGLLHQSAITNGSLRSIREVFDQGERVQALITELDPGRGRIGLNTALLEGPPGELLVEKDKVMQEAADRAKRAQSVLKQQEQDAG